MTHSGQAGPHSNAHGPNEFLHVPTGKRLTACVARVIADHFVRDAAGDGDKDAKKNGKRQKKGK